MVMQSFLFVSLLICAALSAPVKHNTAEQYNGGSTVINESDRRRSCPDGYEFLGKDCARTITIEPEVTCNPGYEFRAATNDCVRYMGLESECPTGFSRTLGVCTNTRTAPAGPVCPAGYNLRSDGTTCMHLVPLADHDVCPAGSEPNGDICIVRGTSAPELVCPAGFVLEANKCEIEETYDCTPARPALFSGIIDKFPVRRLAGLDEIVSYQQPIVFGNNIRVGSRANIGVTPLTTILPTTVTSPLPTPNTTPLTTTFMGRAAPAGSTIDGLYEDYVVQSTCKRIRIEPARKVCPNGVLEGKECSVDIQVQPLTAPGGFVEEVIPANEECPPGYSSYGGTSTCSVTEEIPPTFFCPSGTRDLGDRCAQYTPIVRSCPAGFALEGNLCVQTEITPQLVEYTVTYACVGKECGA